MTVLMENVFLIIIKSVELQGSMAKSLEVNEEGFTPQERFSRNFQFCFFLAGESRAHVRMRNSDPLYTSRFLVC